MRCVSFTYYGSPEWGVVIEPDETSAPVRAVLRAADLEERYFIPLPASLGELITAGKEGLVTLGAAIQQYHEDECGHELATALEEVTVTIPFLPPRNLIGIGRNYPDGRGDMPAAPVYFSKPPTTLIACGDTVPLHGDCTSEADYEGELAVIIGAVTKDVTPHEAAASIFGYTVANDITARDLQQSRQQWFYAKALDGFTPIGPYVLIGARETPFHLTTHVNDELRQSASTDEMHVAVTEIISDLSRVMTLLPGDILLTGTPAGTGSAQKEPAYLREGDRVRVTIDGIGTLTNTVGR